MNRRQTLKLLGGTAAFAGAATVLGRGAFAQAKPFSLPPLGYPYEALEPHIDTATMGFHHKNHHNAFITNLNGLVDKWPEITGKSPEEIVSNLSAVPEAVRTPVRNNMGGHWNHVFFWDMMTPGGAKAPAGDLKSAIDGAFGDFDKMKAALKQAAMTRFGSGWAWLAVGRQGGDRHRRVGARLLPQAPVPPRRLCRRVVERGELGQGGGELQEGNGVGRDRRFTRKKKPWRSPPGLFPCCEMGDVEQQGKFV
jgi:Fe-Mn family superoxide dismutase